MSERIDRSPNRYASQQRYSGDVDENVLRELELLRAVNEGLLFNRQHTGDDTYDTDNDEQWQPPLEEVSYEETHAPRPSDWGASALIDQPVTEDYYARPIEKERIRLPRREVFVRLGFAAAWLGIIGGSIYDDQIDNPYSMVASLPVIGKDDPAKKELLDTLLANCEDGSVGDVLYRGDVSAESSVIWNVPNADGTLSPLLPTRLDPDSNAERYPKAVIENSILTIGACDSDGQPAVNIHGTTVKVDLSRIQSRIMLEKNKAYAEGIPKGMFDESVKAGAFPQATADALYAEMTDPSNIDLAVNATLHEVGTIIVSKDSTYDQQVEDVSRAQIIAKITAELAAKSPGIAYQVETANEIADTGLVGMQDISTDKLAITDAKVVKATITVDPSTVNS
jgi:hypothetical protein